MFISTLSWNLDGLDDKNLELRTNYVINLVERYLINTNSKNTTVF